MKRFLVAVLLCISWIAFGQAPILRNAATTNNPARTANSLPANTSALYPMMVLNPDGSGADRLVHYSPYFTMTLTNASLAGNLSGNGAILTNILRLPFSTANTLLMVGGVKDVASVANAIGILTNDGAGAIGYTTNLAQAVTYQNVTYNVSRGGQLTITTNLIIQTNAIVTLSNLPSPSVLVLATNQQVTNATLSGLTLSDANVLTATGGGGDTTGTNIVTLTQTGTNVSAMDFSLVQNGGVFKLSLTNNAFIPTPSNVGNTAFRKAWLMVQQPSTGTCLVSWTNATFAGPEGQTLVNDTNNGAVVIYEMVSDVFTNGLVHVFMSQRSKLMP